MTNPGMTSSPNPSNQSNTGAPAGSDDDSPMRSRGAANKQSDSGVEGVGGVGGGTPTAGGLGSPGGAQPLATGPARPQVGPMAGAGGQNTWQIPDNAVADSHQHPSPDAPLTFGDPSPYLAANAPAERHTDGSLSVAGGSAGSAVGTADDLDATPSPTPDDTAASNH